MKNTPSLFRVIREKHILAASLIGLLITPPSASATTTVVNLELSLVVDVSGSVSASEYTLQMNGYASAFESSSFHSTVSSANNGIAVNLIQFSSSAAESIPWSHITNATTADAFAAQIRGAARLFSQGTNIESGINAATASLNNNNFSSKRSVIDVSGDGPGSSGAARDNALANGVTSINGIVISDSNGSLQTHYEQNVAGGAGSFVASAATFEDFEPSVLGKITREVQGEGIIDNSLPVASALRQTQLALVHSAFNDVNARLYRLRSRHNAQIPAPAPMPSSDKGSYSAKGGGKEPIIVPIAPKRWEAFGSIHFYTQDVDGSDYTVPGSNFLIPISPDYQIDIFGGTVGIEYLLNERWAIGGALVANSADVDMDSYGDIDTDGYGIAVYASYYHRNLFNGPGDWYADLLYGYSEYDNDIDRKTFGGTAKGSTDSTNHTVAFHTGYNLTHGSWIHGPYASLEWTDGDLDGYTESGPGAAVFPSMGYESLLGRIGYSVSKIIPLSRGTLVPQIRAAWEHEFEDDEDFIGTFPLGLPDEDRFVAGAGIAWEFSENGRLILNYEGRFASDFDSHQVNLHLGYKF